MPIYEYECTNCHHHFDLIQKINDAPAKQCPQCFQNTAVKLVSAAGFQLKGTGWYATDFKDKGKTTSSSSDVKKSEPATTSDTASKEASTTTKTDAPKSTQGTDK